MAFDRLAGLQPQMLSVLRIMTALLYLEHGTQKLFSFPAAAQQPPLLSLLGLQGVIEILGGTLLALGAFVRPVAFLLAGDMAVAYFMVHAPRSFFPILNGGTTAVLYCFIFLYLAIAGGGIWAIDALRARARA